MLVKKSIDRIVHYFLYPSSQYKQNRITLWLRELTAALFNLLSCLIIFFAGILDTIKNGFAWPYGFLYQKNGIPFYHVFYSLLSSIVGGLISVTGHMIHWMGIVIRLLDMGRPVNESEKEIIVSVFHQSVNPEIIRIIPLPFWNKHFFVLHNYIFTPSNVTSISSALLIHEVVHIWQFRQEGCSYIFNALAAQIRYGIKNTSGNAYDWKAELKRGKIIWQDFNKEAAAQFIEDVWKEGASCIYSNKGDKTITEAGNGKFFQMINLSVTGIQHELPIMISKSNLQDYTALAMQAVKKIRSTKY